MMHIRTDNNILNSKRRFACGIGPDLPPGDTWRFQSESLADRSDCPKCNPGGPRQYGTPISGLSGTIGEPGYAEFLRIASGWGYD